ncbi:MAG: hypothetical protein QG554_2363, partial [Pseudomonadota bacterium]|nr:hypothetical protein [Pseudomonadota bacterium]
MHGSERAERVEGVALLSVVSRPDLNDTPKART